jgi:diguanylate cyclase (GGDEF)-like protein
MTAQVPTILIQLVLLPVLYFLGAKLSLALAVTTPELVVVLWVPNSLVLAALFHFHLRRYAAFAAMIILAELAADYQTYSFAEPILFGAINLLEVTLAYLLLRRWRFDTRFSAPGDLWKFIMAGPVIGAFASACAASALHYFFHGSESANLEYLRIWWFSDGLGLLILTPLLLSIWPPTRGVAQERAQLEWYDGVAIFGALVVLGAFLLSDRGMFHGISVRPVLLMPLVVYAAARFSIRTTTAVMAGIALVVLLVTRSGQQPFGDLPAHDTGVWAQELLFSMAIISLGLAALLSQLRSNRRELETRVQERTAQLQAANAQLEKLAVTDALTGLLNRRALSDLFRREIERAQRHRRELAVIMFDVDHFKAINDRHGHAAGDAVLRQIAGVATQSTRSTDTIARYGGEEFVLVAPETDKSSALELAERMRAALQSAEIRIDHQSLKVTASFGVAMLHGEDSRPEDVLRRADEALYAAKGAGRNRVVAEPAAGE